MTTSWPLIGRDEALARAVDAVRHGHGVLVAGPAGVGKTRLAREVVAEIAPSGCLVDWTVATSSSQSIPFGVLAHLLEASLLQHEFHTRADLLRRVGDVLVGRAGGRPYVLVVDDAQWLDDQTVALVHLLVSSGAASVVLTFRTGERLAPTLHGLWKDEVIERIDLDALTPPQVEQLLGAVVNGPLTLNARRHCWNLSRGNPLFLRELTLAALQSGALGEQEGVFDWTGAVTSSTRLTEILEQRLSTAGPAAREVLEILAIGEPVPTEIVVSLCGADGLADAERASLVLVSDDEEQSIRLCHPLYSAHLREAMTSPDRRCRLRALGDAFEARPVHAERELVRLAAWRLDAGGSVGSDLLTRAAERANSVFDHPLAVRLAERAVADGGGFRASLALGWALMGSERHAEAAALLDELSTDVLAPHDIVQLALARYRCASYLHGFRVEFDQILRDAEMVADQPDERSFLRSQRATLLGFAGRLDEALELDEQIRGSGDEAAELRAIPGVGIGLVSRGLPDRADARAVALVEPALRLMPSLPEAPFWVFSMRLSALVAAGRHDAADQLIAQLSALLPAGKDGTSTGMFALLHGIGAVDRGQIRSGVRLLREAVEAGETSTRWRVILGASVLVEACALLGDADGATRAMAAVEESLDAARVFEGFARRARGWQALAGGRRVDAGALLADAADWSAAHGQFLAEMRALHDLIRLGGTVRTARRLLDVASRVEGPLAECIRSHASAVQAGDGHRLEEASAAFERLGATLMAAEVAGQAAAAYIEAGLHSRADRCRSRATALAALCEGAHSPALHDLGQPAALTRRESEIARLAVSGLSARRIGEVLCLSTRTVEGHLHRTYQKLGVRDRDGLARVLGGP